MENTVKKKTVKKTVKTTAKVAKAKDKKEFWATGRRKTSVARVRLVPGEGSVTVNNQPFNTYFGTPRLQLALQQPFQETGMTEKFNVAVLVNGGGKAGQAIAVQHGISRALISMNPDLRKPLKISGLLTRDPREKERRKVGHRKARRSPQYSKR